MLFLLLWIIPEYFSKAVKDSSQVIKPGTGSATLELEGGSTRRLLG